MYINNITRVIIFWVCTHLFVCAESMNLIVIMPDDHSQRAMGAYGDRHAVTPNFDQLATEGVRFSNAYAAAPVCSPSRAAVLSGKYPSQVGVNDFLMLNENYIDRGLDPASLIYPQVLKENGYVTGMIGKWHLGTAPERHPLKRGFDYFVGYEQDLSAYNPTLDVNGQEMVIEGHTSDIFVEYAKEFLSENKDKKFSLNISFREPQMPWDQVPPEDMEAVAHIDPEVPELEGVDKTWLKNVTRNNYAAIHALDRAVGDVLAEVRALGLEENTIIIYVGDHGMIIGQHGYFGRGAVGAIAGSEVVGSENIANLFEEAIKIPFIVRWPGNSKGDLAINTPVSNVDVFPTILEMLGIGTPEGATLQGRDLTSILKGQKHSSVPVYAQYDMENFGIAKLRMVRMGVFKMVKRFGLNASSDLTDELYHLGYDPNEQNNLIADPNYRQLREILEKHIYEWMVSINDPAL